MQFFIFESFICDFTHSLTYILLYIYLEWWAVGFSLLTYDITRYYNILLFCCIIELTFYLIDIYS